MAFGQNEEVEDILNRTLDNLSLTITSRTGQEGAQLRQQIGILRANFSNYISTGTFSTRLLACFTAAYEAGVKLDRLANVRKALLLEDPQLDGAHALVQAGLFICLSTESRMISDIDFVSRDDVEAMIKRMRQAFDEVRQLAADEMSPDAYQTLTTLAGALIQHLAATARPLPQIINLVVSAPMPALTMSQRVYYVGERWEELARENKVIHPAFMPLQVRGLSA